MIDNVINVIFLFGINLYSNTAGNNIKIVARIEDNSIICQCSILVHLMKNTKIQEVFEYNWGTSGVT